MLLKKDCLVSEFTSLALLTCLKYRKGSNKRQKHNKAKTHRAIKIKSDPKIGSNITKIPANLMATGLGPGFHLV